MAEAMLWNKDRGQSVRASKIRNFGIYPEWNNFGKPTETKYWKLFGWYNEHEHFSFGSFNTEDEAREFLEKLHKQIEGKE